MIIFTRQSFDNGWDIMDLLFLHHIFILLISISSAPTFLNVSLTTAYANLNLEGLSVFIVFLIFRPDPCYDMLPLNFKWNRSIIHMLCIFSYSHRIFEINQHRYTTNSTFICTFNVFRSIHFICIFQDFLDPVKGACPLPDPPPLYAPSHKCLHIENYPATPLHTDALSILFYQFSFKN